MRCPRLPRLLLVGMAVLLISAFSSPAGGDDKTGQSKEELVQAFARLDPGMTPEQVRAKVPSPPRRIARQLLYHRYLEQWIYDQPFPARLTFDCQRGQKPRLLEKPLLPSEKR